MHELFFAAQVARRAAPRCRFHRFREKVARFSAQPHVRVRLARLFTRVRNSHRLGEMLARGFLPLAAPAGMLLARDGPVPQSGMISEARDAPSAARRSGVPAEMARARFPQPGESSTEQGDATGANRARLPVEAERSAAAASRSKPPAGVTVSVKGRMPSAMSKGR